jgi:streptogramin lyase
VQATPDGKVWVSEYTAGKVALLDPRTAPHTDLVVPPGTAHAGAGTTAGTPPNRQGTAATPTKVTATTTSIIPLKTTGWIEYPIAPGANVEDMRPDSRGRLFFEDDNGRLGILDPFLLRVTEYPVPSPMSGYYTIALQDDDHLWFAESGTFAPVATKVGILVP